MMISGVSVSCVILDFSFLNKNADIVEEKLHGPVLEDPKKSSSGLGAKKKKKEGYCLIGPLTFLRENQDLKNAIPVPTTLEQAKLFYNSSNNRKNVYL